MSLHLRWRIAIPYIFLIIAVMTSTAIYLSFRFRQQSLADLEAKLESETSLLAENLASYKGDFSIHNEDFNKFANTWADILDARITIIAPDGVVIGESDANIFSMENHLERPEIQQALATGFGRSTRYSQTEGREFLYTAVPISGIGEIKGFVRIAITTEQIQSETALFIRPIIFITIVALILAIIFAAVIAEYLSRPIHQLTWAVKRVAVEDLQLSPILSPRDELGQLANAFEAVVSELVTQIKTYELEQRKLEAVLKQLADGVVIVDDIGTIQVINPAAQKIFNIEGIDVIGQSLAIVTRHHDIVNLWKTTHQSKKGEITSIEISTGRVVLQASGIPLADLLPGSSLLVFHDVTRVRHLETVRRDFISNISHELRTPLASLKALTETLQDGALEDENVAMHFLNQMEIEVDSLSLMVQELLELSRIESGRVPLKQENVDPFELVNSAVERMRLQAERNGLNLEIHCAENLPNVNADFSRMEQVIVNLLHNAIKFTPRGGLISISCYQKDSHAVFSVTDTGEGISAEDFPRIFERFYKADRSRTSGGTGLGLAISKHLVEAHDGEIWVESTEGKGSTFYFSLPFA